MEGCLDVIKPAMTSCGEGGVPEQRALGLTLPDRERKGACGERPCGEEPCGAVGRVSESMKMGA